MFDRTWPAPAGPPSSLALAAVAVGGVAAAVAIPTDRPGIGWLVTALVLTAVTLGIRWHTGRSLPPLPVLLTEAGWTVAAVALTAVAAVRDAQWLVVLCLLAAFGAASLAVAGRSFRSVGFAAVAVPIAALRALPWLGSALANARRGANRRALRMGASVFVGLGLLAVFVPLLASADAAFGTIVDALIPDFDASSTVRWIVLFCLFAAATAGACFLLVAPPAPPAPAEVRRSRLRSLEWALPVGILTALFGMFVIVQLTTLFGSDDYVLRTTGLTYAEYARSGFWQLLTVTVLAFGVIVLGSRWAPAGTPAERAWKRGLLGALTCLTLVIVASALSRMWLYQQAYGFTVLRLVVLTCELWLGAGFLMVLVSVLRLRPTGLARGMVAAGVLALLSLAVLDPERFVADHNVTRFEQTGKIDTRYLATLSADALPALVRLPEPQRACALSGQSVRPDTDWRSANLARASAVDAPGASAARGSAAYC